MKKQVRTTPRFVLWCALLLGLPGCITPFEPDVKAPTQNFLVVDGFINSRGVTTIKLTRSLGLKASNTPTVEARATMYIEEEGGQRYTLREAPAGTYSSGSLTLNASKKHRLRFSTTAGKEYLSDYTTTKLTPAIDAVTWKVEGDVKIAVSTHDNTNSTRFYRWDCDETWEFRSAYRSRLVFANNYLQPRLENIYECWASANPGTIKLGNTSRLNQDVVADYPLLTVPNASSKLRLKYSLLVRQYAQTQEEFAYWEALRKNTENIGTLFDPLPSQLTGNVHAAADPAELVMGFVGAYSVAEKRIFIDFTELPRNWRAVTGYESCAPPDTVLPNAAQHTFQAPGYLPIEALYNDAGGIIGYTAKSAECIDCRQRGTNVRPSFWK